MADARVPVLKTYKLFIGGAFPRSESARSFEVTAADGTFVANAARASRKDARDAVVAARKAFSSWSGVSAYNRGQVLYRVAEMMEGRREQFSDLMTVAGATGATAADEVAAAIDRWVWYAGWSDKVAQVAGSSNPVAGPFFNFSVPEAVGVCALLAPERPALLGLVSVLAPPLVTGNTAVVVAPGSAAPVAITLAEVLATSDVPAGAVNILTGDIGELAPVLAAHMAVDALDVTGAAAGDREDLERQAAGNLKRLLRPPEGRDSDGDLAWGDSPGTARLLAFTETKTVWHPVGI